MSLSIGLFSFPFVSCSILLSQLSYFFPFSGLNKEAMQAMLKQQNEALNTAVSREDFLIALSKVNRSVSDHDLERFTEWMAEFGSA